jgi:hypothetical protein
VQQSGAAGEIRARPADDTRHRRRGTQTIVGFTQGLATGELWGVSVQMFSLYGRHNVSGADLWLVAAIGL